MKLKWRDASKSKPKTDDSIICFVCEKYNYQGQTRYTYSLATYHKVAFSGTGIKANSWESQNEVVAWVYLKDINLPTFLNADQADLETE